MKMEFRPLSTWPGTPTARHQRKRSPFSARYGVTLELLDKELRHLGAKDVIIEADCDESQIRLDGQFRAGAKMNGPGIILSFKSRHGPLRYPCDKFLNWDCNLRAIALALESLRRVDRYGVTKNAEQYRGWKALPGAEPEEPTFKTLEDAAEFISASTGYKYTTEQIMCEDYLNAAYKTAAFKHHPDRDGDAKIFTKIEDAKRMLEGAV